MQINIDDLSHKISRDIKTTADYVELSKLLHTINTKSLVEMAQQITHNQATLIKLFAIEHTFVNQDLLKQIYNIRKALSTFNSKVNSHQERIHKERN